jgi:hypothetical protein
MHEDASILILIDLGLRRHVTDHWQTHLEAKLSPVCKVVSVPKVAPLV